MENKLCRAREICYSRRLRWWERWRHRFPLTRVTPKPRVMLAFSFPTAILPQECIIASYMQHVRTTTDMRTTTHVATHPPLHLGWLPGEPTQLLVIRSLWAYQGIASVFLTVYIQFSPCGSPLLRTRCWEGSCNTPDDFR